MPPVEPVHMAQRCLGGWQRRIKKRRHPRFVSRRGFAVPGTQTEEISPSPTQEARQPGGAPHANHNNGRSGGWTICTQRMRKCRARRAARLPIGTTLSAETGPTSGTVTSSPQPSSSWPSSSWPSSSWLSVSV